MGICSFCMGDEDKNAKGTAEDMISCAECGNCGKKSSCLQIKTKMIPFRRTSIMFKIFRETC